MKELVAKIEILYRHQEEDSSRTICEFRIKGLGYHLISENHTHTLMQGHSRAYQWSDHYQPMEPFNRPYRCVFTRQPYHPVPLFPPLEEWEEENHFYEVKNWSKFRLYLLGEALHTNAVMAST